MAFFIHVEKDPKNEFNVTPCRGLIGPSETQQILLDFIPDSKGLYSNSLIFDIDGTVEGIARITIRADCRVPVIALEPKSLDFGECFLNFPFSKTFAIHNPSKIPAKFQILNEKCKTDSVDLTTDQLGARFPLTVRLL